MQAVRNGEKRLNHDGAGRFTPGNQAARGARHASAVAGLRRAFVEAITVEDMQRIARALVEKAAAGDVKAAEKLLAFCLGRPDATTWTADNLSQAEQKEADAGIPPWSRTPDAILEHVGVRAGYTAAGHDQFDAADPRPRRSARQKVAALA
ncbi:MAG: hypothetical protein AMXMBFR13_26530 [Phycisphaerae bacterium]